MRPLRNLPIKRKLMLVITLTSAMALALACGAFFAFEITLARSRLMQALTFRADIIGDNSQAALTFNDPKAASATLATLKADPSLISACIYAKDGLPFAAYQRAQEKAQYPARPGVDGLRFTLRRLALVRGIFLRGERIGTIYLAEDLQGAYRDLAFYLGTSAVILLIASISAFFLSARFQRLISDPILDLTRTTKAISRKGDYSARALKRSQDELGVLVDSFNEMLGLVQARDDALRLSEQRLRDILDFSTTPIFAKGVDGRYLFINKQFEGLFQVSPEKVIGKTDNELWPEKYSAALTRNDKRVLESGEAVTFEETVPFQDGVHTCVCVKFPMRDAAGEPYALCGIATDITERKRAEEELQRLSLDLERRVAQRTADLAELNKELESFCYSVSHDLRAPLRAIDGFSLAVFEDCADKVDAASKEHLKRIRGAAKRMGEIIDDMLTLAHVSRGELRHGKVDLSLLARGIAALLKEKEPDRKVTIEIDPGLVVWGDSGLLRIMMDNLINNAWKFTSQTPQARIEFKASEHEGRPLYCVRDNGVGFESSLAKNLFRPFVRLHTSAEFSGTGVGLATVGRIIKRHGGRFWAEGAKGKGAAIYFTL